MNRLQAAILLELDQLKDMKRSSTTNDELLWWVMREHPDRRLSWDDFTKTLEVLNSQGFISYDKDETEVILLKMPDCFDGVSGDVQHIIEAVCS